MSLAAYGVRRNRPGTVDAKGTPVCAMVVRAIEHIEITWNFL
jgi:hypothetical protein